MKKMLNILKWTVIIILIVLASIRIAFVESRKDDHLRTCKETYKIRVKTLFSWYDTKTCRHYN
jgi:hypothetical protein